MWLPNLSHQVPVEDSEKGPSSCLHGAQWHEQTQSSVEVGRAELNPQRLAPSGDSYGPKGHRTVCGLVRGVGHSVRVFG